MYVLALVWPGLTSLGLAWSGHTRLDVARCFAWPAQVGVATLDSLGSARPGPISIDRLGCAWLGVAQPGQAELGLSHRPFAC